MSEQYFRTTITISIGDGGDQDFGLDVCYSPIPGSSALRFDPPELRQPEYADDVEIISLKIIKGRHEDEPSDWLREVILQDEVLRESLIADARNTLDSARDRKSRRAAA